MRLLFGAPVLCEVRKRKENRSRARRWPVRFLRGWAIPVPVALPSHLWDILGDPRPNSSLRAGSASVYSSERWLQLGEATAVATLHLVRPASIASAAVVRGGAAGWDGEEAHIFDNSAVYARPGSALVLDR